MVKWIKETLIAELELLEMHFRHLILRQSYSDASHTIAMRSIQRQQRKAKRRKKKC